MSESTSLREAIARVIFKGEWRDPESEFAEQQWAEFKETYLAQADDVLVVLTDPSAEVIQRFKQGWEAANERGETGSRVLAGFRAAFGGEQA